MVTTIWVIVALHMAYALRARVSVRARWFERLLSLSCTNIRVDEVRWETQQASFIEITGRHDLHIIT